MTQALPGNILRRKEDPLDRMENHRLGGEGSQPSTAGMGRVLPLSEQHIGNERAQTIQPEPITPVAVAQTRVQTRIVEHLHR